MKLQVTCFCITDQARQTMGLSTETYKSSEYDRLSLSLLSPMPNEQDFAINVCTLLSNEGKHTLRLEKCPRLVDFLLAHAGVYSQSKYGSENLL
jgi:AT-rich interactive domain-containing protein 2